MASTSDTSDKLFLLDQKEDFHHYLLALLEKGARDVAIFSRKLNPLFFDHDDINDTLSKISRASRNASIRIAIQDPQAIVDANHKLLKLCHRLSSKIKIQKIIIEPQDPYEFVIVDDDKLWLQHSEKQYTGFANFDARPEVKRFLITFNDLWKNSEEDVRLRNLVL